MFNKKRFSLCVHNFVRIGFVVYMLVSFLILIFLRRTTKNMWRRSALSEFKGPICEDESTQEDSMELRMDQSQDQYEEEPAKKRRFEKTDSESISALLALLTSHTETAHLQCTEFQTNMVEITESGKPFFVQCELKERLFTDHTKTFEDHVQVTKSKLPQLCSAWKQYIAQEKKTSQEIEEKIQEETKKLSILREQAAEQEREKKAAWIQCQSEHAKLREYTKELAKLEANQKTCLMEEEERRAVAQEKLNKVLADLTIEHQRLSREVGAAQLELLKIRRATTEQEKLAEEQVEEKTTHEPSLAFLQTYRQVFPHDPAQLLCNIHVPKISITTPPDHLFVDREPIFEEDTRSVLDTANGEEKATKVLLSPKEQFEEILEAIYSAILFEMTYDTQSLDNNNHQQNMVLPSEQSRKSFRFNPDMTLLQHLIQIRIISMDLQRNVCKTQSVAHEHVKELQNLLLLADARPKNSKNSIATLSSVNTFQEELDGNSDLWHIVETYGCQWTHEKQIESSSAMELIRRKFKELHALAKEYHCFSSDYSHQDPVYAIESKLKMLATRCRFFVSVFFFVCWGTMGEMNYFFF